MGWKPRTIFDLLTTKGDLSVHGGSAPVRLPVGTDDQVLTADSAEAAGVRWADATGGTGNAAHSATIGDGSATEYQVTHSLGTQDLIVQLWDVSGAEPLEATGDVDHIEIDDDNNITVTFGAAPATDSYRVVIVADGGASSGGGGYAPDLVTHHDDVPGSPDADDDEFDDESITGWTEQHGGNAATWSEEPDGMLWVTADAETGWNLKTQHISLPGSGDWEYELKLGPFTAASLDFHKPGMLCLIEGTTADGVYILGRGHRSTWETHVTRLSSYTSFNSNVANIKQVPTWPTYLRIEKSGTTYTFKVSMTGGRFYTVNSGSLAFTPASIGPGINVESGSQGLEVSFEHFRRIS